MKPLGIDAYYADKAKEVIGMTKRISGPFEDEERQVEWQKEVLRKADEWLKNLKDTFPHIKDEYKGYAADRINLLEWLIKQVKSSIKTH